MIGKTKPERLQQQVDDRAAELLAQRKLLHRKCIEMANATEGPTTSSVLVPLVSGLDVAASDWLYAYRMLISGLKNLESENIISNTTRDEVEKELASVAD